EVAHHGLSQWNGVAVASRVGLEDARPGFDGMPGFHKDPEMAQDPEARAISAVCDGVRVYSLYIPNGRELADPHYTYKLDWLARLREHAAAEPNADPSAQIALTGDLNVAPEDEDVWDMEGFDGKTHVSPPERDARRAFARAGFRDIPRAHTSPWPGASAWRRRTRTCGTWRSSTARPTSPRPSERRSSPSTARASGRSPASTRRAPESTRTGTTRG